MNHEANTTDWKPGDIVVHDADAKNPDMLIRIVGRTGESRYACEYLNREKRVRFIGCIFTNGRESLHDPARFGIDVSKCFPALHAEIAKLKLRIKELEDTKDRHVTPESPRPINLIASENMKLSHSDRNA